MIDVEVGDDEVINLFEACDGGRDFVDAAGVALSRISSINEDGFSTRSDEKRRPAALRVDPIDFEAFGGADRRDE